MDKQDQSEGLVKILFSLEQDEDGYPPVTSESLWAKPVAEHLFELDNIPFYACGISWKDMVAADPLTEGTFAFSKVVKPSGHSTIRVIVFAKDEMERLQKELGRLGASWEGSDASSLVAIDIPPEVDIKQVLDFLQSGMDEGRWDYEEASIQHSGA
jgi:hypothetical protein